MADVVLEAAREMRGPMAYATLIVAFALIPVVVLEGVAGAFLPTAAVAFLAAAGVSMVVALTVTPALGVLLLARAPLERREPPVRRWLHGGYERILGERARAGRAVRTSASARSSSPGSSRCRS